MHVENNKEIDGTPPRFDKVGPKISHGNVSKMAKGLGGRAIRERGAIEEKPMKQIERKKKIITPHN